MRIRYAPYLLKGKNNYSSRSGALLEFSFEDLSVGYADCHPWPELGDDPIEKQIASLGNGCLTPLTLRSLDFAMLDAQGRAGKKNLFRGLIQPKNHCLVTSEEMPNGFDIYKCKDPVICLKLLPRLSDDQKIRMDFNFRLTRSQFVEFIARAKPYLHKFDYIEDPFTFNNSLWSVSEKQFGIPLALDRAQNEEDYLIRVVKPAVDLPLKEKMGTRHIYTSYLDHPFGQLTAAYVAALNGTKEVCGLATHLVYQENIFSSEFLIENTRLVIPINGSGFGFDDCLREQDWRMI